MDYPAFVYRCPGAHFGPDGTTYDALGVNNDEQMRAALVNGWQKNLVQAVEIYLNSEKGNEPVVAVGENVAVAESEEIAAVDDNTPPTREELEQKATALGIKFDGRTTDRKLLERIEEVLRGE